MVGKSFQVLFSGTARQRLKEITAYATEYSNSKAVGSHVRRGILFEAKKLEKLPASKPILPGTEDYDYKVYYTKAWNYKIIFRILTSRDVVRILTIRHDKELDENVRACWDFAFGANAAKFCSDRGVMREHSLSYVTEEQRRAGQNLARAAQRVKSQQALRKDF